MSLKKLSDEDVRIVRSLREASVLENVDTHQIAAPNGFMAMVCSDCDHSEDKFQFLCRICSTPRPRVHFFALNSGGMLLSPSSPTREGNEEDIFTRHVKNTMAMKNMDLLILKCHAPCGAAYAHSLNFYDVLRHAFEGKRYVKSKIPELRVAVFVQVYHAEDERRRTYFVEGKKWLKYAKENSLNVG